MCDADAQSLRNGASLAENALDEIMFAQSTLARTSSTQDTMGYSAHCLLVSELKDLYCLERFCGGAKFEF